MGLEDLIPEEDTSTEKSSEEDSGSGNSSDSDSSSEYPKTPDVQVPPPKNKSCPVCGKMGKVRLNHQTGKKKRAWDCNNENCEKDIFVSASMQFYRPVEPLTEEVEEGSDEFLGDVDWTHVSEEYGGERGDMPASSEEWEKFYDEKHETKFKDLYS